MQNYMGNVQASISGLLNTLGPNDRVMGLLKLLYFKKDIWKTKVPFVRPLISLVWTSDNISGIQTRVDRLVHIWQRHVCHMLPENVSMSQWHELLFREVLWRSRSITGFLALK